MQNRRIFLVTFVAVGFLTKLISEFVHEILGHGPFVLLFGGTIESVCISVLWPYDNSYINWLMPSNITSVQTVLIYASGILVCVATSFAIQSFLLVKRNTPWCYALPLFWLGFWLLANSSGYLLLGGLAPFGDVYELIRLGALTNTLSLFAGFAVFLTGFLALSWILRGILTRTFSALKARFGVVLFWFIVPALFMVMQANPERNVKLAYLPLMLIPILASLVVEYFLISPKQGADKSPDNITVE